MKCIDYDADFQCNLAEKFPTFVPKPKPKGGSKKPSGADDSPAGKEPKSKAGQKRKRSDNDFSDDNAEPDEGLDEGTVYNVRGTRSRPA
jgi:hypothetical protein